MQHLLIESQSCDLTGYRQALLFNVSEYSFIERVAVWNINSVPVGLSTIMFGVRPVENRNLKPMTSMGQLLLEREFKLCVWSSTFLK